MGQPGHNIIKISFQTKVCCQFYFKTTKIFVNVEKSFLRARPKCSQNEGKRSCANRIKCVNSLAESCSTCKQSIYSTCFQTHVAMRHSENINPLLSFLSTFHLSLQNQCILWKQMVWQCSNSHIKTWRRSWVTKNRKHLHEGFEKTSRNATKTYFLQSDISFGRNRESLSFLKWSNYLFIYYFLLIKNIHLKRIERGNSVVVRWHEERSDNITKAFPQLRVGFE